MAKNSLKVTRHEDKRRTLIEWLNDFPIRSCKVLIAKDECDVGNHYHKLKDEVFYLLKGTGEVTLDGVTEILSSGDIVYVPALAKHSFLLTKDSILLGGATKMYDKSDEYKS